MNGFRSPLDGHDEDNALGSDYQPSQLRPTNGSRDYLPADKPIQKWADSRDGRKSLDPLKSF